MSRIIIKYQRFLQYPEHLLAGLVSNRIRQNFSVTWGKRLSSVIERSETTKQSRYWRARLARYARNDDHILL